MKNLNFFYDRLYGHIEHTEADQRLYETPQLVRLHDVSLSAIPPWVLKCGMCASKFEHSIGAGHLARIVGQGEEFAHDATNIYFAVLNHDAGTPPMSHLSERFLQKLHGVTHEEFAKEFLFETELGDELTRQGGDLEKIYAYIIGNDKPLSDLVNGSIDLDNLDNSLRYGLSKGIITQILYDPEIIAHSYRYDTVENVIYLDSDCLAELPGWEEARVRAYSFVYSHHNMSPASMLYRALDLATRKGVDEIPFGFFKMTDHQAYNHLETKCNIGTRLLAEQTKQMKYFELVYSLVTETPNLMHQWLANDSHRRGWLSDQIADYFGIPYHHITAYTGRDKGFKKIHLEIRDSAGATIPAPQSLLKDKWYMQVFISPENAFTGRKDEITKMIRDLLELNPPN